MCMQDRVIAVHPFSQALALAMKKYSATPYIVLVHDLHEAELSRPEIRAGLQAASDVLCVSENIMKVMRQYAPKVSLLYPTPGLPLGLEPAFSIGSVGLGGHFCCKALKLVSRLGFQIEAIGRPVNATDGSEYTNDVSNVRFVPRFNANDDAIRHISNLCSAFCVAVPNDGSEYATYSFPSKFIDFARAGLPIVIIAGIHTAIGQWAHCNDWPLFVSDEHDSAQYKAVADRLRDQEAWNLDRARVLALRDGDFSNATINAKLLEALRRA
jgi:hypothetical protein